MGIGIPPVLKSPGFCVRVAGAAPTLPPIAQRTRAAGFYPAGRPFESVWAGHILVAQRKSSGILVRRPRVRITPGMPFPSVM